MLPFSTEPNQRWR